MVFIEEEDERLIEDVYVPSRPLVSAMSAGVATAPPLLAISASGVVTSDSSSSTCSIGGSNGGGGYAAEAHVFPMPVHTPRRGSVTGLPAPITLTLGGSSGSINDG